MPVSDAANGRRLGPRDPRNERGGGIVSVVVAPLECFHCGLPVPGGRPLAGPSARGDSRVLLRRVPGRRTGDRGKRPRPLLPAAHGERADSASRRRGRGSILRSDGAAGVVRPPRRRPARSFAAARGHPMRGLPVAERGAGPRAARRRRGGANYAGQSVRVLGSLAARPLRILAAVRSIGYRARPLDPRHRAGIEAGAAAAMRRGSCSRASSG